MTRCGTSVAISYFEPSQAKLEDLAKPDSDVVIHEKSKQVGELNMKKRLLLMLIAVVCLSPSIVFAGLADGSYVGTSTTTFKNIDGQAVSEKGGPSSIGPFQRAPAASGSAPANPAPPSECARARKRINETDERDQGIEQRMHSGDAV